MCGPNHAHPKRWACDTLSTNCYASIGNANRPRIIAKRCAAGSVLTGSGFRAVLRWIDADPAAVAVEAHDAFDEREERIVLRPLHAFARMEVRAALTHDNAARGDVLAGKSLHAKVLRIRIAPIARRALALLMCHISFSLQSYPKDSVRQKGYDSNQPAEGKRAKRKGRVKSGEWRVKSDKRRASRRISRL